MTLIGHACSSQFMEWQNYVSQSLSMLLVPQMFFKNCWFYLPNFLKFCDNISHKLLRTSQLLEKIMEILECSTLHISGPFLLLNVAAYWNCSNNEACAKNCLRYLKTTLIMRLLGLVSECIWGIVQATEKAGSERCRQCQM